MFSDRIVNALPAYRGIGPIRSDDGGATWVVEETASGSPGLAGKALFALAVDPTNRENVVAATTNGLYQRVITAGKPQWVRRRAGECIRVWSSQLPAAARVSSPPNGAKAFFNRPMDKRGPVWWRIFRRPAWGDRARSPGEQSRFVLRVRGRCERTRDENLSSRRREWFLEKNREPAGCPAVRWRIEPGRLRSRHRGRSERRESHLCRRKLFCGSTILARIGLALSRASERHRLSFRFDNFPSACAHTRTCTCSRIRLTTPIHSGSVAMAARF